MGCPFIFCFLVDLCLWICYMTSSFVWGPVTCSLRSGRNGLWGFMNYDYGMHYRGLTITKKIIFMGFGHIEGFSIGGFLQCGALRG